MLKNGHRPRSTLADGEYPTTRCTCTNKMTCSCGKHATHTNKHNIATSTTVISDQLTAPCNMLLALSL